MKIFVANSGRCGSKFMAEVVKYLTDIPAFHEPIPWCVNKVCHDVNNLDKPPGDTLRVLEEKIKRIRALSKNQDKNYFEANQMFIKSFADFILLNFCDVYCIYLHRNPLEVLASYHKKCLQRELDWFLLPHWKKNVLRLDEEMSRNMSFLEIVEWNWYEVKARFFKHKKAFVKTWDFDFKEIGNLAEYYRMFDHFGIEAKRIPRLPDFLDKNSLINPETKGDVILDMIASWNMKGKEGRRFPLDIQQLL